MLSHSFKLRLLRLLQRNKVEPCVCRLESDPPESRFAIREITLDSNNVVVAASKQALSPKASSSEHLRGVVQDLLAQSLNGPVSCGETNRQFSQADLESWLAVIGKPVFSVGKFL